MPIDAAIAQNLSTHQLDLAVAREEGYDLRDWPELGPEYFRLYLDNEPVAYIGPFDLRLLKSRSGLEHYTPSVNILQSHEIVEREFIATTFDEDVGCWVAWRSRPRAAEPQGFSGKTSREAAMRCYVATGKKFPRKE